MSILIKGLDMPKDRDILYIDIYSNGKVAHDLDLECKQIATAISVPPHGRLIDADALLSQYKGNIWTAQTDYAEGLRDAANDIKQAPAIIEAEEGK